MPVESFEELYEKRGGRVDKEMGLVEKAKTVLLSPSDFFNTIKAEHGLMEPIKYLAVFSLVNLVMLTVISVLGTSFYLGGMLPLASFLGSLQFLVGIIFYLFNLVFSFIGAGISHLFLKLVKAKGNYGTTYRVMSYSSTPILLFAWVPVLGMLVGGLYSLYLNIKGMSMLHDVSVVRVLIAMLVIPFAISFMLSFLLMSFVFTQGFLTTTL